MRVCLFSKNYGSLDGCAQSVFDVIVSLVECDIDLNILYNKSFPNIDSHDGYNIKGKFNLYQLPRKNVFDIMLHNKKRLSKIQNITPDLCIVNGISGHRWRNLLDKNFCDNNLIIIRESPQLSNFKIEDNSLELMIEKMRYYQNYIFVSYNVMCQWKDLLKLDNSQIKFIPNCINEGRAKEVKKIEKALMQNRLNFNNEKFNIVCVASIQKRKGQDLIFNSIKKIINQMPDIHFHIVGKEKKPESEKMISEIPKTHMKYFTFHGSKDNALEYMRASDAMILPSRSEAFPRVTLESIAVGTPVIISDVDGNTEQIIHNKTGKVFSNEDCDQMIDCIKDLYDSNELRSKFSDKAFDYYSSNFTRRIHVNNFKLFFNNY
jgi:glycosyltransferase involved in cell wall biosynthesis